VQQPNNQDPIVEIFVLAYRRGLAIKQNSQPQQIADTTPLNAQSPRTASGAIAQTATTDDCRKRACKESGDAGTTK
jgi:hypothetical protein